MEAGYKFKEEIIKLRQELMSTKVGTLAGDRILEEAENDPNLDLKEEQYRAQDGDDQAEIDQQQRSFGVGKLNQLFSKF